jgi:uncharacterized protein (DUF1778 family)
VSADRDGRASRSGVGRDRRHVYPGRARAVNARFTDDEYAELAAAAELAELTPTGFCAQAALDVARTLHTLAAKADNHALASLQAELLHARVTLNQLRAGLNLARADERTPPEDLDNAVAGAVHAVATVDNVITHIHRQLGARRLT